jgi:hypothetical protein
VMKKAKQNLSVQKLVACKSVLCAQVSVQFDCCAKASV